MKQPLLHRHTGRKNQTNAQKKKKKQKKTEEAKQKVFEKKKRKKEQSIQTNDLTAKVKLLLCL